MFRMVKRIVSLITAMANSTIGGALGVILFPMVNMLKSPFFYIVILSLIPGVMGPVLLWGLQAAAILLIKIGLGALLTSPLVSMIMGMSPFFLVTLAANFVADGIKSFVSSVVEGLIFGLRHGITTVFTEVKNILLGESTSDGVSDVKPAAAIEKEKESLTMVTQKLDATGVKSVGKKVVKSIYPVLDDMGIPDETKLSAANESKIDACKTKSSTPDDHSDDENHAFDIQQ